MYSNSDSVHCNNLPDPIVVKIKISLWHFTKMSTMSSATASARDWVPFDESTLKNWICFFILTKRDGTSFDVSSVLEEDIIEICVRLGHTNPLGVIWYLAMELVALFCSTEDMQCATHRAIKAMELQDEAIAIRATALSETHVRAYIIAVGGDPSKPQSPPSGGRRTPFTHW